MQLLCWSCRVSPIAVACLFFSLAAQTGLIAATQRSRAAQPASSAPDLSGIYVGTYECAQGPMRLQLRITSRTGGAISALFTFYPTTMPAGARTDSYAFSLSGRYNAEGDTSLSPQRWQSARPPAGSGYVVVGMRGRFDVSTGTFSGVITGTGCGNFSVRRDEALSTAEARPTERTPQRPAAPAASAPPATRPAEARPAPARTTAAPTPPAMAHPVYQQLAADPRLPGLDQTAATLALTEAGNTLRSCEEESKLVSQRAVNNYEFYDCGCFATRLFNWRLDKAGVALTRRKNPNGVETGAPFFAKDYASMMFDRAFVNDVNTCISTPNVEQTTRRYATDFQAASRISDAHKECVINDVTNTFRDKTALGMMANEHFRVTFQRSLLSCQQRSR